MSTPGWYPDPASAGEETRWRWFDGKAWTAASAGGPTPPRLPPADPGGPAPRPPATLRSSTPWLVAVAAMVLVGLALSFVQWRAPRVGYIPSPGPGAPVSLPVEPSRPPSECPVGATFRNPHPDDNNAYGGRLVLPKAAIPYDKATAGIPVLSALEDAQTWFVTWRSGNPRQSGVTMGELRRSGFYVSPQEAARRSALCMTQETVRKADVTGSTTVTDTALTVGGRPAWLVVVDVTLNPAKQLGVTGERLVVVVVDDGRPDWMSALAVTVRNDQPEVLAAVEKLPAQLKLVA